MTPQQLFDYASRRASESESQGHGTQYPTFREVAKRFNIRYEDIEQACMDWDHTKGYMAPGVAIGGSGGVAGFGSKGQYVVEAYV